MADLWENNNKEWFDANRKRYLKHVRDPMKTLAESLAGPVSTILPEFVGNPKISRINNDIRFNPKKPLYKEHVWISFSGSSDSPADIFAAIGRNGWATGCGIGASRREPLDGWRKNLLQHADKWRLYRAITCDNDIMKVYLEGRYKKPLYPDIPEDLEELIQAKGVWIVDTSRTTFDGPTEAEFFNGFCRTLPIYLFMAIPPAFLPERLEELGTKIPAPNDKIGKMWQLLHN